MRFLVVIVLASLCSAPTPLRAEGFFSAADRLELELPVGTIFNQHRTNYCWAYSSFHSLRTYYFTLQSPDENALRWKAALDELNEPTIFRAYLKKHFANKWGEPMRFNRGLVKNANLPDDGWKAIVRGGRESYTIPFDPTRAEWRSLDQVKRQIRASLEQGIPTAYCGDGHCTAIYGAVYDGDTAVKYLIADSVNHSGEDGRKYEVKASKVHGSIEIIMAKQ